MQSYVCSMDNSSIAMASCINPPDDALNAPKYGTIIPNRIFVGGIASDTSEEDLKNFFTQYGSVKDGKIIADRAGVSKGYGFITFENQEDAEKILTEFQSLAFNDRKLNIAPAIRKQQAFPKMYGDYDQTQNPVYYSPVPVVPYTYQNGMAFYQPDNSYSAVQSQPSYPLVVPQQNQQTPLYMPQSYGVYPNNSATISPNAAAWTPQTQPWRWAPQQAATPTLPGQCMYTMQSLPGVASTEIYGCQPTYPTSAITDISGAGDAPTIMEAAPQEGNLVMDSSGLMTSTQHYVEPVIAGAQPPQSMYTTTLAAASYQPVPVPVDHQPTMMTAPVMPMPAQPPPQQGTVTYKRPAGISTRTVVTSPGYNHAAHLATPPHTPAKMILLNRPPPNTACQPQPIQQQLIHKLPASVTPISPNHQDNIEVIIASQMTPPNTPKSQ